MLTTTFMLIHVYGYIINPYKITHMKPHNDNCIIFFDSPKALTIYNTTCDLVAKKIITGSAK